MSAVELKMRASAMATLPPCLATAMDNSSRCQSTVPRHESTPPSEACQTHHRNASVPTNSQRKCNTPGPKARFRPACEMLKQ
ncbi:hypothetical protein B0T16DRAFT_105444 [Cercophora newfieldiana]|uniref:Uncharacterized protein n=1 Tax=Cercophora newfieldiana TaxID=92897 RepID=A0AA39YHM3_9PEZI|nr:hypothetical protein B0T16DRAFT_105444 [Cercophora newfieldiana]